MKALIVIALVGLVIALRCLPSPKRKMRSTPKYWSSLPHSH